MCAGKPIVKSGSKIAISGKIIGEETPQLLKNYASKKKVRIITTVSEVIKGASSVSV